VLCGDNRSHLCPYELSRPVAPTATAGTHQEVTSHVGALRVFVRLLCSVFVETLISEPRSSCLPYPTETFDGLIPLRIRRDRLFDVSPTSTASPSEHNSMFLQFYLLFQVTL
jgi:hypothetical protein